MQVRHPKVSLQEEDIACNRVLMPVFLLTDVLQVGRENIARKTAITSLHPQVCDFIVHNPKHYIDVVTFGISVVCLIFLFFCALISVGIAIGVTVAVVLLLIAFVYTCKRNPKLMDRLWSNLPNMPSMPSVPSVSNFPKFR